MSDQVTPPASLKLQAFLAHAGIASRRQSEALISQGKVMVNGEVAQIGQRVIPGKDKVYFGGKLISQAQEHHYILVDKPVGLVSTTSDELGRPTVLSVLPAELKKDRLYPVGRLDQDSEGLILLTDDGDLAYRLTHPKFKVKKTYLVKLDRLPTDKAIDNLKRGVKLKEGKTARSKVEQADEELLGEWIDDEPELWFTITIHEGRNRQVRRMWERVGYEVQKLIRISMGRLHLDQLEGETFKVLDDTETRILKESMGLGTVE